MSNENFKIQWKKKSVQKSFLNPLESEEEQQTSIITSLRTVPENISDPQGSQEVEGIATVSNCDIPRKRSQVGSVQSFRKRRRLCLAEDTTSTSAVSVQDSVQEEPSASASLASSVTLPPTFWNIHGFPAFVKKVDLELNSLLWKDSILQDLADKHISAESVEALLAFESGQGVCIKLKREDGSILPIYIKKTETVLGLKKRIRTETERELKILSDKKKVNISWKHIWRQNWLITSEKLKLIDHNARLIDVGLTNNSEIKFLKKLREKKQKNRSRISKKRKQVVI